MTGSIQLQRYLAQRALGATMHTAAASCGIGIAEARLTENELARGGLALPDEAAARAFLDPAPIGHNQPKEQAMSESIAADELRLLIERIERLEEEKKALADDIKDVYAESKARGYDTRTMREIVKLRKLEKNEREEREALLDTYKAALGMDYAETPLGRAAIEAAGKGTDVVKLAVDIHNAGGRMVGDTLVMPMGGLKEQAERKAANA